MFVTSYVVLLKNTKPVAKHLQADEDHPDLPHSILPLPTFGVVTHQGIRIRPKNGKRASSTRFILNFYVRNVSVFALLGP
jgi:hypothetical protein